MLNIKRIGQLLLTQTFKLFNSNNFIIFVGILSILPFIIISIFNNPSADDFNYNCRSRNLGFWNAQLNCYASWSGRYVATAILSVRSLVSNSFFIYKLIPILLLAALFISIYYLASLLFDGPKKRRFLLFTFFVFTTYLIQLPSVCQGFYWLSGSISYQLPNILSVILFYFLIQLIKTNKTRYLAISIFCTILIIGSNETSMVMIDFLIAVIFIFKYLQQKKINYSLLALLVFAVIFSLIVINSPGNAIRASKFQDNHQILITIVKTVLLSILYCLKWLPIIFLSIAIYYKNFCANPKNDTLKIFDVNPIFIFLIICFIPLIGFFPGVWSMGYRPPPRTINVIYFYFLMGVIYLAFVSFHKIEKLNSFFTTLSKWNSCLLISVITGILVIDNNIKTVYSDLLSGNASAYNTELKNRYILIQNNKKDTCQVPKLRNKPSTIFFEDITNNPKDWKNESYGAYFKTKTIVLKDK